MLRNLLKIKIFSIILLFVISPFLPFSVFASEEQFSLREEVLEGRVTKILENSKISQDGLTNTYQKLQILISKGSLKDKSIIVENGGVFSASNQKYEIGDNLVISYSKDLDGQDLFFITDYVRRDGLLALFLLFVVLVIFIGRIWGVTSLLGMSYSFVVIFVYLLPQIINGAEPIFTAILSSIAIIPITFILSHGFKKKTIIAITSTIITLTTVGLLAGFFVELTHLTGFSAEEAGFLQFQLGNKINMKGILLAGIIISSLGILDDITISQASIVGELKSANKKLKSFELFQRAMKVGRDHIASLVNTLILVYAGASLPLLLVFVESSHPFAEIINYEIIAVEIVKTLVGSIGLVLAVPITTALAVYIKPKTISR